MLAFSRLLHFLNLLEDEISGQDYYSISIKLFVMEAFLSFLSIKCRNWLDWADGADTADRVEIRRIPPSPPDC